jgi:CheY-like chemotaxis protein
VGLSVLIVDDNATNRRILKEQIQSWGCKSVEASSGEKALVLLNSSPTVRRFDLILMDFHMPGMDGLATLEAIRTIPANENVPVVLLTSVCVRPTLESMQALGFATVLSKPIRQSHLRNTLLEVVGAASGQATVDVEVEAREVIDLGLKILLAEDNAVNELVATQRLEMWGCEVEAVSNGVEALRALESGDYDVVLMDVQMPEMDGFEATARLREREMTTGVHVPVIAMTAHAMQGDRERCLDSGMDDYLSKPLNAEEMLAKLRQWALPVDAEG